LFLRRVAAATVSHGVCARRTFSTQLGEQAATDCTRLDQHPGRVRRVRDTQLMTNLAELPEAARRRAWAVRQASQHLSLMRPRWSWEEAEGEVMALAEEILDFSCGGRQARLEAMSYSEYLQTPEWDAKRRAAYRKAGYRCQLCAASGTELHAHHRWYKNQAKPGEERDLIVLCARCHEHAHKVIWTVE